MAETLPHVQAVVRTRVRYSETDRFAIAHHSAYVPWFECGRVELLAQLGHPYHEFEARGLGFPLVELHFRYDAPLRLDDVFEIQAFMVAGDAFRLTFGCRMRTDDGKVRARAYSVHAMVDREMRVMEIPGDLQELVRANLAPPEALGKRFGPGR